MSIREFTATLCQSLEAAALPSNLHDEKDLEQKVVVPIATHLAARHSGMLLCVHPFGRKDHCKPSCDAIPLMGQGGLSVAPSVGPPAKHGPP